MRRRRHDRRRRAPLLIVEDDPALQKQICWAFDQYETLPASDRESALAQLRRHAPPVVTMDLGLPPDPDSVSEGFKLLEQILALAPDTKVIVLTGQNDRANALRADRLGAYDFFAKPFEPELLSADDRPRVPPVRAAAGEPAPAGDAPARCARRTDHARSRDAAHLPARSRRSRRPTPPCCCSAKAAPARNCSRARCTSSRRAAPSASWRSTARRFPRPCSRASCSATRRAPSPARPSRRIGKIETANRGTLLLDEIGDLPLRAAGEAAALPAGARDRARRRARRRSRSTCASSARRTRT